MLHHDPARASFSDDTDDLAPAAAKVTRTERLAPFRGAAIQAKGLAADAAYEPALFADIGAQGGAGRPLSPEARAAMERSFGADFSDIRVHESGEAEAIGAIAFARGSDLHFAGGAFDPSSEAGRRVLGHELAHVIQQREGRVAPTQARGGLVNVDAGLEREADELGERAARGEVVGRSTAAPVSSRTIQMFTVHAAYKTLKAVNVTTSAKAKRTVPAGKVCVCTGSTNTGDEYIVLDGENETLTVKKADATAANFAPHKLVPGEAGYLPNLGPIEQHGLFTDRKGADSRRESEASKKQKFHSVKTTRVPALGKQGQRFDPKLLKQDTIGTERIQLLNEAEQHGQLMTLDGLSRRTGQPETKIFIVCAYTLEWIEVGSMDSDHVVAQVDVARWRENLVNYIKSDPMARERFDTEVEATGMEAEDFYYEDNGDIVSNQQGASALYANTANLVPSDKVVNQQDKSDVRYDKFLAETLAHGQDFLDGLPANDPTEVYCEDGTTVAKRLKENTRTKENTEAIERNWTRRKDESARSDRSVKILEQRKQAKRKRDQGKKRKADEIDERATKQARKEDMVHIAHENVSAGVQSQDDEYLDEKEEFLKEGLPYMLDRIERGESHDVESDLAELAELRRDNDRLRQKSQSRKERIEELEEELEKAKKKIAKLKKKSTT